MYVQLNEVRIDERRLKVEETVRQICLGELTPIQNKCQEKTTLYGTVRLDVLITFDRHSGLHRHFF